MGKERLFREMGEAILCAQLLEMNIRVLIAVLNRQFQAGIDERSIIVEDDRQTLGRLIWEMKKHGDLDEGGARLLSEALDARNYLAHHFFALNAAALDSEDACEELLVVLSGQAKRIVAALAITEGFIQAFCKAFGICQSDILVKQEVRSQQSQQSG
jgi:hypothetical protein